MIPPQSTFIYLLCFLNVSVIFSQIKIGDNPQIIAPSSLLELESTTKTFVINKMSNLQMEEIEPLSGALVYNIDEKCMFFYDGLQWVNICDKVTTSPGEPFDPNTVIINITNNYDGTFTVSTADNNSFDIDTREHMGLEGSIFFGDELTGEPVFDRDNLYWDNEDKKLGIGTVSPENTLDVKGLIKSSRIHNGGGSPSYPGYHFQGNTGTGMFAIIRNILGFSTNGKEAVRIIENGNVGINVQNPMATLHVGGDLRVDGSIITSLGKTSMQDNGNAIRRLFNQIETVLHDDETLIISNVVERLELDTASSDNVGRRYILKDLGGARTSLNVNYIDSSGKQTSLVPNNSVIWIQSDGRDWHQVN